MAVAFFVYMLFCFHATFMWSRLFIAVCFGFALLLCLMMWCAVLCAVVASFCSAYSCCFCCCCCCVFCSLTSVS